MNPVTGLALGRIAVGVASLAKPSLISSTLAPGAPVGPPLLTQWFGSREIALGVLTLLTGSGARRHLVLVGMAVDAADAATAYAAVGSKSIPRETGLAMVGVASGAVLSGLLGLRAKKTTTVALTTS